MPQPYPVEVRVPVPQPYPVRVPYEVKVPQPYPVHVPVDRPYPVEVRVPVPCIPVQQCPPPQQQAAPCPVHTVHNYQPMPKQPNRVLECKHFLKSFIFELSLNCFCLLKAKHIAINCRKIKKIYWTNHSMLSEELGVPLINKNIFLLFFRFNY